MNYSGTIAWKVKRCHWPLKAVEADGGVASGRAGRGGVMSASGMGGGGRQRRLGPRLRGGTRGAEVRRRRGGDFLLCSEEGGCGVDLEGRGGRKSMACGGGGGNIKTR